MENDTQISCFTHGNNPALLQFYAMLRWICVLSMFPCFSFSQSWTSQEVIPVHHFAYQKKHTPVTGLASLPALLGIQEQSDIGISIENKYGITALSQLKLSIGQKAGMGKISINGSMQGGNIYTHFSGSINYGLMLNKNSSAGISIGVASFKLKGFFPETVLQSTLGIAHHINEKTLLAIHYQHQRALALNKQNATWKMDGLTIGIGYQLSEAVFLQLEVRKQLQLEILPVLHWRANKIIGFWSGLNTSGHLAIGVSGFSEKRISGIAIASHPQLGYTIQLQLNQRLYGKK